MNKNYMFLKLPKAKKKIDSNARTLFPFLNKFSDFSRTMQQEQLCNKSNYATM